MTEINALAGEQFLKEIRTATASQHEALEQHPLSIKLMSEHLQLSDYRQYLECMLGVVRFYDEQILPQIDPLITDASSRKKSAALESDLHYLEQKGIKGNGIIPFEAGNFGSLPYSLGWAYVIEGSTLGGRVIIKHIGTKMDIDAERGASYFNGYGAATGENWKRFLQALTKFAVESGEREQVIDGAKSGFEMIYRHFDKI